MNIIKATGEDTKLVFELFKSSIENMNKRGLYFWDENYPNINIISEDIKNEELFIIKNKEKIAAAVTINEVQPKEYDDLTWKYKGKILVVHRLVVNPVLQGLGLAKILMNFSEDFGMKNEFDAVRLDTYSDNEIGLKLYNSLEFQRVGQVYYDKEKPFICFEKSIK